MILFSYYNIKIIVIKKDVVLLSVLVFIFQVICILIITPILVFVIMAFVFITLVHCSICSNKKYFWD